MAKKVSKKYSSSSDTSSVLDEAALLYIAQSKKVPALENFTYKHFDKIASKSPFTIAQWADVLYISERTLQRYAKANTVFSGLLVERILHLEKLINAGNRTFGSHFNEWLHTPAFNLNGEVPYQYLFSYAGIEEVINMIGRIQHGIVA